MLALSRKNQSKLAIMSHLAPSRVSFAATGNIRVPITNRTTMMAATGKTQL